MLTVAAATPSLDLTYVVDRLRLGAIHRPAAVVRCAGGKALNLARAAHTLGAEVRLAGLFGGGTGRWLVEQLEAVGIAVSAVPAAAETRTCVSIADATAKELTELYPHAEPPAPTEWDAFSATAAALAASPSPGADTGWFAMSGGAPPGLADDALADVLAEGRTAGLRTAVDTHGAALAAAVAVRPDLVKVNRAEAAELLAVPETTPLGELARGVRALSGGIVVLTDGADGALGLPAPTQKHTGDTTTIEAPAIGTTSTGEAITGWRVPVPGPRGMFPVGSGDSFLGGLLAALDRGEPLAEALRWATACGTANALVPGAGVFTAASATELYAQITPESVAL